MSTTLTLLRPLLRRSAAAPRLLIRNQSTTAAPLPAKPAGGLKRTLYGFLAGSTLSGTAAYVYLLEEFRKGSEIVSEDVDALRASVLRIESYVRSVEDKIAEEQAARKRAGAGGK
ncbi:hypothetical protein DFH27DRAFT_560615 [Peziza echinospora]|nr:hypothetical protein DFH27DRAFT_560615 [Peziza echinospora]